MVSSHTQHASFQKLHQGFVGTMQCPSISAEKHLWAKTALIPWIQRSVWNGWSGCGWEPEMSRCSCPYSVPKLIVEVVYKHYSLLLTGFFVSQETTGLHSNLFLKADTHLKGNLCVCIWLSLWCDEPLNHNGFLWWKRCSKQWFVFKAFRVSMICQLRSYLYRNSWVGMKKGIFLFTY